MENVIWTATIREEQINQPEIVECLAILRSLQLCLHLGFLNLLIESDCQLVGNELNEETPSSSYLGNLFHDIKALMANFQQYNITFCYRHYNRAAHNLVRFVWNVDHIVPWLGEVLEFLLQTVWFDKQFCIFIS